MDDSGNITWEEYCLRQYGYDLEEMEILDMDPREHTQSYYRVGITLS